MADELREVDTTPIDELAAIKVEQDRLAEFRGRAQSLKDGVDPLVYRRVNDDYEKRQLALDRKAIPLRTEARKQYQKFQILFKKAKATFEKARLDKEELEFRHALGELTDELLVEKVNEPEERLAKTKTELDELEACKERFLSVFASEKDLEVEPPPPPEVERRSTEPPPPPPDAPPELPAPSHATVVVASPVAREAAAVDAGKPSGTGGVPAAPPPPAGADLDVATAYGFSIEDIDASQPPPLPDEGREHTFVVPDARLIPIDDSTDGLEYRLGAVTAIGRAANNQIRLVKAGVSRRHAAITLTDEGFVIEDLDSQNGTFINGERVPKHRLVDGDELWIGDVKVKFSCAWTPVPKSGPSALDTSEVDSGDKSKQARGSRRS